MNQSLRALAVLSLTAAAALPASAQITGGSIPVVNAGTFNLAEAYPCTAGTYAASLGITSQQLFNGTCAPQAGNPGAAPGILSLSRSGNVLNVNCFATIPSGQTGPCFVQAFRLTKQVPGSFKCPDVYGVPHFDFSKNPPVLIPYTYTQFSNNVRTWWSLNFTQPGTRFVLDVVAVCRAAPVFLAGTEQSKSPVIISPGGQPVLHEDEWTWRVVADTNTLGYVIDLMHEGAVSTLEVPCIIGEDMYDALKKAQARLAGAVSAGDPSGIGNAIFDMEALIVSNCLFTDVLQPLVFFRGPDQFQAPNILLPGNLSPTVSFGTGGGTAVAGIIDTIEHPCCCKLLVDLEWIAIKNGIIGQTPTLPTF